MKTLLTILCSLLALSSLVEANPIIVELTSIEKTWERCMISVGERDAHVSCAIGYKVHEKHSNLLTFRVPIYWPSTMRGDAEKIIRTTSMRIESGGRIFYPKSITRTFEDGTTDTTKLRGGKPEFENPKFKDKKVVSASIHVDILQDRPKDFTMVLSYTQPLIDDTVHYLPLFEEEKIDIKKKDLSITFFPAEGQTLELLTIHPERISAEMKTRITIIPRHQERISVKAKPSRVFP